MDTEQSINRIYGGKLRVRVCGFCFLNGKLLLINQKSKKGSIWLPPGGGLEYGETINNGLKREFLEETGLKVEPDNFLFLTEFIQPPLHAIEIFYRVKHVEGEAVKGYDPEFDNNSQLINEVRWMTQNEIEKIKAENKHSTLQNDKLHKISTFFSN